ncbi:uncharacterized protein JCM15063_002775 [Sporobolomyces koalae]|uniref:uncharacterized protein n=1 Tax=Sporobolomyces koalae TaxID=500713 RepID=UPI0031711A75
MSDQPASFAPLSPNETRAARARSLSRRPSHSSLHASTTPSAASTSSLPIPVPSASSATADLAPPLPTYSSSLRSRHSLYGTEDRVVLDLGSRVWKVGFSGEAAPRHCVRVERILAREQHTLLRGVSKSHETDELDGIWTLDKCRIDEDEWQIREERLKRALREVWFDHLMTDPKSRKVLVVENPMLSTPVKEMIARVLFDNLQVPSVNFACAPLLSLMASGSVTGLVVDAGHLETTVLPIYHARPLFSNLTSTPLAGSRLNERLRSLLVAYGSYAPPPATLNSMTIPTPTNIPRKVLTEELVEEIKTLCCFVGGEISDDEQLLRDYDNNLNDRYNREASTTTATSSAMDVDSTPAASPIQETFDPDAALFKYLYARYSRSAPDTTSVSFRIPHLSAPPPPAGVGRGHLAIPSWIRERAAEVLFDSTLETHDSLSIQSTILECVLSLPIDLRKPMIQNIVVTGGTASLPGFIPRLRQSLLTRLRESHPPSPPSSPPSSATSAADPACRIRRERLSHRLHTLRHSPRYAPLVPLAKSLSILNNPSPTTDAPASDGSAPAFHASLYAWVGGSLAGALKVGGQEITREEWEEGYESAAREQKAGQEDSVGEESMDQGEDYGAGLRAKRGKKLPDWTHMR